MWCQTREYFSENINASILMYCAISNYRTLACHSFNNLVAMSMAAQYTVWRLEWSGVVAHTRSFPRTRNDFCSFIWLFGAPPQPSLPLPPPPPHPGGWNGVAAMGWGGGGTSCSYANYGRQGSQIVTVQFLFVLYIYYLCRCRRLYLFLSLYKYIENV